MRFLTRFLCINFAVLALTGAGTTVAMAQDMPLVAKPTDIKALDTKLQMATKDLIAKTQVVSKTPNGDPLLAYTMRIPTGWTEVGANAQDEVVSGTGLSNRLLNTLTRYVSPPIGSQPRSEVVISAVQLDYFVSTEHWFMTYLLAQRYAILGVRVVNPGRVEALYQKVEGSDETVVRALMQANGARLMLVEHSVPLIRANDEHDLQIGVMASFKLTQPDTSLPEPVSERSMLDIVRFLYPGSWFLASPPVRSDEEMRTTLVQTAQDIDNPETDEIEIDLPTLKGRIEIIGRRRNGEYNAVTFTSWLADQLREKSNIRWKDKLAEQPDMLKTHETVVNDGLAVYPLLDSLGRIMPQEVWLQLMHTDRYDYAIVLLTPARTSDYASWARNISAFELVSRSLKSPDKQ